MNFLLKTHSKKWISAKGTFFFLFTKKREKWKPPVTHCAVYSCPNQHSPASFPLNQIEKFEPNVICSLKAGGRERRGGGGGAELVQLVRSMIQVLWKRLCLRLSKTSSEPMKTIFYRKHYRI